MPRAISHCASHLTLIAALVVPAGGCRDECEGLSPRVQIGYAGALQQLTEIRVEARLGSAAVKSATLTAAAAGFDAAAGRGQLVINFDEIVGGTALEVTLVALSGEGELGRGSGSTTLSADACNRLEVDIRGAGAADGGVEAGSDGAPPDAATDGPQPDRGEEDGSRPDGPQPDGPPGPVVIDLAQSAPFRTLTYAGNDPGALAACDVDGDGADDLVISVPTASGSISGQPGRGRVYVLRGPSLGATTASAGQAVDLNKPSLPTSTVIFGADDGENIGEALHCADLNGDNRDDVVIGVPGAEGDAGRIYVYPGRSSGLPATIQLPSADVMSVAHAQPGARFGAALTSLGGSSAQRVLAVGAPGESTVYLLPGSDWQSAPDLISAVRLKGASGDGLGTALAAGRLDPASQHDDLLASAPGSSAASCQGCGAVFGLRGRDFGALSDLYDVSKDEHSLTLWGVPGAGFGWSLLVANVDKNPGADLLVGAPLGESHKGNVFVFSGGAGLVPSTGAPTVLDSQAGFRVRYSGPPDGNLGWALAGLRHDLGAGRDLIASAPMSAGAPGQAYLLGEHSFSPGSAAAASGAPNLQLRVVGVQAGFFGRILAAGRFVGGDPLDDMVVGDPQADTVYVIQR